jgi:hypothetical protein
VTTFGCTMMCEQAAPDQLVRDLVRAEECGFDFSVISDHYQPWLESQGHSGYTWSILGAAAQATERIPLMTYVTCPILRYHPGVVAQKAATMQILSGGRFRLGLGSGESLNEHVVGMRWPTVRERHEMLSEAVDIISALFDGGNVNLTVLVVRTVPPARCRGAGVCPSRRRGTEAGVRGGALITCGLCLVIATAGCGVGDDRDAARAVTERFYAAISADDGAGACMELGENTVKQLESQSGQACAAAVTGLQLSPGAITSVVVYATNAKVDLDSGESAFLSPEPGGWRLSAIGCKPEEGKPRDRPLDCEVEA